MIWREKRVLLIILGVLLLGNVVFFLTYRVQYQSRLDEMDERLAQIEGQLEQTRRSRITAEQSLVAYRRVEKDVQTIFNDLWSTQPRRLTRFIGEVKRLAEASNAVPQTLSFDKTDAKLVSTRGKRDVGAKEVGIGFSVDATYEQTRRMINLFELSDQFVIIDEISLNAGAENRLSLNLRLKTLFREDEAAAGNGRS
jgi:Tfp pilus assembly protein PilO